MTEANIGVGRVCKQLIESGETSEKERLNLSITAAQRIAMGMEIDKGKILRKNDRDSAIKDFELAASELFKVIEGMEEVEKFLNLNHFMRALENDTWIKNQSWRQAVFKCTAQEVNLFIQQINKSLETEDYKSAIGYIKRLTFPRVQMDRLASTNSERQQVKWIMQMGFKAFQRVRT